MKEIKEVTEWIITDKLTQDHEGQKISSAAIFELKGAGLEAYVKYDGCVTISDYSPANSFHICEIDTFIEQLQALKEAAKREFGDNWEKDFI